MSYSEWIAASKRRDGSLTRAQSSALMEALLLGRMTSAQTGTLLATLAMRGHGAEELLGAARVLAARCRHLEPRRRPILALATSDEAGGWTAMMVAAGLTVAAAGLPATMQSGRSGLIADVMQALGIAVRAPRSAISDGIDRLGFALLHEGDFHVELSDLNLVRKDIGIRTLIDDALAFAHPVSPPPEAWVFGTSEPSMLEAGAQVLAGLGVQRGYVVSGDGGVPCVGLAGITHCIVFEGERRQRFEFDPVRHGFGSHVSVPEGLGLDVQSRAESIRGVLSGRLHGLVRELVVANAGFCLHVGGAAATLDECFSIARRTLDSGKAAEVLKGMGNLYQGTESSPSLKPLR